MSKLSFMHKCDGQNCTALVDEEMNPTDAEGQYFCDACEAAHMAEGYVLAAEYKYEAMIDQAAADWRGENRLTVPKEWTRDRLEDCIDRADMERKRIREEGK
jgi:hypothetical protein